MKNLSNLYQDKKRSKISLFITSFLLAWAVAPRAEAFALSLDAALSILTLGKRNGIVYNTIYSAMTPTFVKGKIASLSPFAAAAVGTFFLPKIAENVGYYAGHFFGRRSAEQSFVSPTSAPSNALDNAMNIMKHVQAEKIQDQKQAHLLNSQQRGWVYSDDTPKENADEDRIDEQAIFDPKRLRGEEDSDYAKIKEDLEKGDAQIMYNSQGYQDAGDKNLVKTAKTRENSVVLNRELDKTSEKMSVNKLENAPEKSLKTTYQGTYQRSGGFPGLTKNAQKAAAGAA